VLTDSVAASQAAAQPAAQEVDPADFSPAITNPLFTLSSIGPKVFEGESTDPDTGEVTKERLESRVLPETRVVAGVTVTVLEEKAFEDGELVEVALDFFAQHRDGSVYYFGEEVDNYEDGQIKDHGGAWLAGESANQPGIIMPAAPQLNQTYEQEDAPGVAEDMATVLVLDETVTVPSGTYTGCMKTREFTPLEPGIEEFKWHCPGVGLVKEEGDGSLLELVSVSPAPQPAATAPAPTTAPATAQPTTPSGIAAPSAGDGATSEAPRPVRWTIVLAVAATSVLCIGAGWRLVRRIRG
jgi:hypothetical protein